MFSVSSRSAVAGTLAQLDPTRTHYDTRICAVAKETLWTPHDILGLLTSLFEKQIGGMFTNPLRSQPRRATNAFKVNKLKSDKSLVSRMILILGSNFSAESAPPRQEKEVQNTVCSTNLSLHYRLIDYASKEILRAPFPRYLISWQRRPFRQSDSKL